MKVAALSLLLLAGTPRPGTDLATVYREGAVWRVERETKVSLETTDMSMERDGVEVERPGDRGGGGASSFKHVVTVDRIAEVEDGRTVEVRRTFHALEGRASMFDQEVELDAPLNGATLLLSADEKGHVDVELEEGDPVEDEALEGHAIGFELDALLPDGPVEEGDDWSPDGEDLLVALGLAADGALFQPPEFELDFGGRGGRGGGGGRGPGGPRGPRGGAERFFQDADWDVTATLTDEREEIDGVACRVVHLTAEGSGSFEPEERFGRGRRGFGLAPAPAPRGTEVDAELEGTLWIAAAEARPVRFTAKVDFTVESDNEFERGGSTMRIRRSQEGTFETTVDVTAGDE